MEEMKFGVWYETAPTYWDPSDSPYDTWNKKTVAIHKCYKPDVFDSDQEVALRAMMRPGYVHKEEVATAVFTHDRKVCIKMYDFMSLADLKDAIDSVLGGARD